MNLCALLKSRIMENQSFKEKEALLQKKEGKEEFNLRPTPAFIAAAWFALFIGMVSYCIGIVERHHVAQ